MKLSSLVLLSPLLAGCPDRNIATVQIDQERVEVKDIPVVKRGVDILFLIDDSLSMKEEQDSLKANFGRFISVLESLEGGLPSVHIGVTSSDLGTSALDGEASGFGNCTGTGKGGALRTLPGVGSYISDIDDGAGGRTRNYTGTLTDVFAQLADVGTSGCGIEQHLEAVKRALDENPANGAFLRDDAYLAVIVIADEDDCSLAQKALFDGDRSDPRYGDRVNFKCTKEGIECDSPATDFETDPGLRRDCHPRADATQLTSIDRYVDFLKGLKTDPRDVIAAGIVGDTEPFETVDKNGVTVMKPSCTYQGPTEPQLAFPAIRTANFLEQFPGSNVRATICNGDLSQPLVEIGALIKEKLPDRCLRSQLADVNPYEDGDQYDCSVVEARRIAGQLDAEIDAIPQCDATQSQLPCWHIEDAPEECYYTEIDPHLALIVERGGQVPSSDLRIKASCVTASQPDLQ